jgi:exodeoxyribonuclease VII small subunit
VSKAKTAKPDVKSLMDEIEAIVTWFETDTIDIDQALKKYAEGRKKIQLLQQRLDQAQATIQDIDQSFEA